MENLVKIGAVVLGFWLIVQYIMPLVKAFTGAFVDEKANKALERLLMIVIVLLAVKQILALLGTMKVDMVGYLSYVDPAIAFVEDFVKNYVQYLVIVVLAMAVIRK